MNCVHWLLPLFLATNLDVGWISRLPEIDYVVHSSNPRIEGWPNTGDAVTWRAHVRNSTAQPQTAHYDWLLDNAVIASGTTTLSANAFTEIDLVRPWSFERHELTFRMGDSAVTVFTDALAVGIWVEQSVYDFMRAGELVPEVTREEYRRAGYIHPIYTPDGRLISDDQPKDHRHHHGVWAAWTKTEIDGLPRLIHTVRGVGYVARAP